jgi:[ribosomal protein S5]-alanine N-acetyltransferase
VRVWNDRRVGTTRLIQVADAAELAGIVQASREFMAPWDPVRPESYFTVDGQRALIERLLLTYDTGAGLPHVILGPGGRVAGRITLSGIVRGPFQSCAVGYWVGVADGGRGLATAALAEIVGIAFGELGLHRVQAETLLDNVRSQRVLDHNGFARFGLAPSYLKIAGRWQDHIMYQRVNDEA